MVDPNRKINLVNDSDEEDFNDEHVQMVKEYEEEFKDRFTERDEQFMGFSKQKPKPPVIVYPFDAFNHRGGGGGGGGGRFNNRGRNFHHQAYNRNNHHDNRRNYNNQQQGNYHQQRHYSDGGSDNKRFRRDDS